MFHRRLKQSSFRVRFFGCGRYGAPVWMAAAMVVAMLLRGVSGLPAVSTPHHHGGVYHTHGAGGIAHDHGHGHDHYHEAEQTPHRHGDGPYHVHGTERHVPHVAANSQREVNTNDFPVYIPVRWPPEAYRKAAEHHSHEDPAAPEEKPEGPRSPYFCAATLAALEAAQTAAPSAVACAQTILPHVSVAPRRFLAGPRQTRAPPAPVHLQNV